MTWRYTVPAHPADRELVGARLWMAGAIGVWDRPETVVGWFESRSEDVPPGGTWSRETQVDWQARWKATIEPVLAGPVAIVPTWLMDDADLPASIQTVVVLDPGQAFGSGHHATTALCTEALAAMDLTGSSVLDVGTGTGVLAIVASRRGADRVVGVDIDASAVEVARANVTANGLQPAGLDEPGGTGVVNLGTGSADAVADEFDVVVANLVTDVVTSLADDLAARVRPGGTLIVSGIDAQRADGPGQRLGSAGLAQVDHRVRDGWVGAVWSRPIS